jgi:hypothetical protein
MMTYLRLRRLIAVCLCFSLLSATAWAGGCSRLITDTIRDTGTADQIQGLENAAGRLDSLFKTGKITPEAWSAVGDDIVKGLAAGAEPLDKQVIHSWVQLTNNANLTDQELAAVIRNVNELRGADKKFFEGLFNDPDTKFASSWIKNARAGNRGQPYEVVAARNLQKLGELPADGISFGKTIVKADGSSALVEGDMVAGNKFIDAKLANGNFKLDELNRVETALTTGQVDEFVFAIEGGEASAPQTWVDLKNTINGRLPQGVKPIRIVDSGPFK